MIAYVLDCDIVVRRRNHKTVSKLFALDRNTLLIIVSEQNPSRKSCRENVKICT